MDNTFDINKKHTDVSVQKHADDIAKAHNRDFARYIGNLDGVDFWDMENATFKFNGITPYITHQNGKWHEVKHTDGLIVLMRHNVH
ncbi:MAG: hypothetical protein MJZ31_12270 [Bacteroidales bacterium]|nr:hypothetical protein [Bacteroidales bacterium]